ncbi:MAG: helix-turn-helix domain-containing protein [Mycobacteriales bacterium]
MSDYLPAGPARDVLESLAMRRGQSVEELAVGLGLDRRTLYRLMASERLSVHVADRFAVACGRHPVEIWPDWFNPVDRAGEGSGESRNVVQCDAAAGRGPRAGGR